jgi:hypothetical protein
MTEEELEKEVAGVIEEQAWAMLGGVRDSTAYKNRRTASLRKARRVIEAIEAAQRDASR